MPPAQRVRAAGSHYSSKPHSSRKVRLLGTATKSTRSEAEACVTAKFGSMMIGRPIHFATEAKCGLSKMTPIC